MDLPQIAQRAFDTPLLAEPRKAHAFIRGLGARIVGRPVAFDDDYEEADHQAPPPFASLLGDELAEGLKRDRYGYGVRDGIGIIPIGGTLIHRGAWVGKSSGQTTYEGIGAQLTAAMDDPTVRAIALEVDSFGGEVAGCFDLADRIRAARETKPIWALLAENACSAAYALASQANRVILPRTGDAGSIGVLVMHADYSRMAEQAGVTISLIHAGAKKVERNPYEPLPDAVRAEIQEDVESLRLLFAETVGAGRGDRLTAEGALATEAACFMGQAAVDAGLADDVAPPREAFEGFTAEVNGRPGSGHNQGGPAMAHESGHRVAEDQTNETAMDDEEDMEAAGGGDQDEMAEEQASASGEKTRIASIMKAPEAQGRESLAQHLALETDVSAETAKGILAVASKQGGGLGKRMSGRDPVVGTSSDTKPKSDGWDAAAASAGVRMKEKV